MGDSSGSLDILQGEYTLKFIEEKMNYMFIALVYLIEGYRRIHIIITS